MTCVKKSRGSKKKAEHSLYISRKLVKKAGSMKKENWRWMKKLTPRKSWISEGRSCKHGCEISRNSLICRKEWWTSTKRSGNRSCKIWSRDGVIFCRSIRKCRKDHKSCKDRKTESSSARRTWPNGLETVGRPIMKSKTDWCNQKIEKTSRVDAELDEKI